MTDEQIIKSLECHIEAEDCVSCEMFGKCDEFLLTQKTLDLVNRQNAEIEKLKAFKSYFDKLYGKGLDIANWHLNGALEPFDSFYESALQEMTGVSDENL